VLLTNPKNIYILDLVKKKLLFLVTSVLSYLAFASSASAQILNTCPAPPFDKLCFGQGALGDIIGAFMSFVFIVAVVAALFYLLWGAVRWIFSGGDKAAIEGARGEILAAIIGLIILFFIALIFNVLLGFFNVNIANLTELPAIPTPPPL